MKSTRRTFEFVRGAFRVTLTSETARGPRLVLNGDVWAHEHRDRYGVRYETISRATRADLIEFAHLNVNPHTGAGVARRQVSAS